VHKLSVGIILGLLIAQPAGRSFDIPVPSPPKLTGALLVAAMTVGYMVSSVTQLKRALVYASSPCHCERSGECPSRSFLPGLPRLC
jgi:XapX domain-containing protein